MAKKQRTHPKQTLLDNKSLFSFDPIRRDVLLWGLVAGTIGGFFMIQQQILWQLLGVFVVVFFANYQISRAARYIPRWQATALSFIGLSVAMFAVIVVGTLIIAYNGPAAVPQTP